MAPREDEAEDNKPLPKPVRPPLKGVPVLEPMVTADLDEVPPELAMESCPVLPPSRSRQAEEEGLPGIKLIAVVVPAAAGIGITSCWGLTWRYWRMRSTATISCGDVLNFLKHILAISAFLRSLEYLSVQAHCMSI